MPKAQEPGGQVDMLQHMTGKHQSSFIELQHIYNDLTLHCH